MIFPGNEFSRTWFSWKWRGCIEPSVIFCRASWSISTFNFGSSASCLKTWTFTWTVFNCFSPQNYFTHKPASSAYPISNCFKQNVCQNKTNFIPCYIFFCILLYCTHVQMPLVWEFNFIAFPDECVCVCSLWNNAKPDGFLLDSSAGIVW